MDYFEVVVEICIPHASRLLGSSTWLKKSLGSKMDKISAGRVDLERTY